MRQAYKIVRAFAHSQSVFEVFHSEVFRHGGFILKGRQGLDYFAGFLLGKAQFVELFQVEPELCTTSTEEVPRRRTVSPVMAPLPHLPPPSWEHINLTVP